MLDPAFTEKELKIKESRKIQRIEKVKKEKKIRAKQRKLRLKIEKNPAILQKIPVIF